VFNIVIVRIVLLHSLFSLNSPIGVSLMVTNLDKPTIHFEQLRLSLYIFCHRIDDILILVS
jgi:hypothetical protein